MLRGSSPTTTRCLQPADARFVGFYRKTERGRGRLGTSLRSSSLRSCSLCCAETDPRRWTCTKPIWGPADAQSGPRSADAQSDPSACMRETHEGPSQSCRGYLPTPLAGTTHLRRLRLGDLSVLGARMGLWPSAGEGLSPILAPNTPALLDTKRSGAAAALPAGKELCPPASAEGRVP